MSQTCDSYVYNIILFINPATAISNNIIGNRNKKRISLRPYETIKEKKLKPPHNQCTPCVAREPAKVHINKHGFAFCTLPVLLLLLFFEYGSVYFYQTTGIIKEKKIVSLHYYNIGARVRNKRGIGNKYIYTQRREKNTRACDLRLFICNQVNQFSGSRRRRKYTAAAAAIMAVEH